jgi:hypothetical protein
MNTCSVVRSSRPAGLFSFGLLDGLTVRLCRSHLREALAGFGLERLATAFMNNPGWQHAETGRQRRPRFAPRNREP